MECDAMLTIDLLLNKQTTGNRTESIYLFW